MVREGVTLGNLGRKVALTIPELGLLPVKQCMHVTAQCPFRTVVIRTAVALFSHRCRIALLAFAHLTFALLSHSHCCLFRTVGIRTVGFALVSFALLSFALLACRTSACTTRVRKTEVRSFVLDCFTAYCTLTLLHLIPVCFHWHRRTPPALSVNLSN